MGGGGEETGQLECHISKIERAIVPSHSTWARTVIHVYSSVKRVTKQLKQSTVLIKLGDLLKHLAGHSKHEAKRL